MPLILPPVDDVTQTAIGKKLVHLAKHANDMTDLEWCKFINDPAAYLNGIGYRFWDGVKVDGNNQPVPEEIPAWVNIVPVVDTAATLHVSIPPVGDFPADLDAPPEPEPDYPNFYSLFARYFMRHCR